MVLQKINIRLSKIILLLDAFSEEPVERGVQIQTRQGKKPVAKSSGYFLFLDMEQEEFTVEITSPLYRTRRICLRADGGREAEEIFLYPSPAYPVKPGTTIICGEILSWENFVAGKAGGRHVKGFRVETGGGTIRTGILRVHLEEEGQEGRLLADYEKGSTEISLFMRGTYSTGKRSWYIKEKETNRGEYFQVRPFAAAPETYCLSSELKADYRKREARIYPAWECPVGDNGEYYLLLPHLKEKKYLLYYTLDFPRETGGTKGSPQENAGGNPDPQENVGINTDSQANVGGDSDPQANAGGNPEDAREYTGEREILGLQKNQWDWKEEGLEWDFV